MPRDSRVPAGVKSWLAAQRDWRTLFIRRGIPSATTRVFAARDGKVGTAELDDVRQVADLDLTSLTPYDGRLYLVCTHGRHDACCAELGRPLWQALADTAPEETWQVSHIGGDRFAANVLVLPDGLYYGRLSSADARRLVAADRAGRVDLAHLRGRCRYPFAAQAAEVFLRTELRETRADALELVTCTDRTAIFERGGRLFRVDVRRHETLEKLTCRAVAPARGWYYELAGVSELT
ncbi:MAG TPA: sucrase ferredoxin [Nocardioidaceae bacterium]|nr:sucrase ferredoxin [Nocardioidaceae bacterium]